VSAAEPKWLHVEVVLAIHEAMLRIHGGLAGVRDVGLLESALARPRNAFDYEASDVFGLAANYAAAIARNRPFIDGNKRTAFVAMVTFLELNGERFEVAEHEAVLPIVALAQGSFSEKKFANWLRANAKSKSKRRSRSKKKRKRR
jgi:death-on-curing protein